MGELAKLLGNSDAVHLDRVDEGSLTILALVDQSAKPLVSPRLRTAANDDAPADVQRAWTSINAMLAADSTHATMTLPSGEIIAFPGRPMNEIEVASLRQSTTIQGRIVRMEGAGDSISVGIDCAAGVASRVSISAVHVAGLGALFHKVVRFSGSGRWKREPDGKWILLTLDADSFVELSDDTAVNIIDRLRETLKGQDLRAATAEIRKLHSA